MKRLLLIILFALLLFLVVVPLSTLTTLDLRPYQEMDYYHETMREIDKAQKEYVTEGEVLRGGWEKRSLIPPYHVPMAGYGDREGALMEGVQDSIWVRAFVFENGKNTVTMFFADLLTIPDELVIALEKRLPEKGFSIEKSYFTATHTHCSVGACYPGFIGSLFGGEYDQAIVDHLADQFVAAAEAAHVKRKPVRLGSSKVLAEKYVYNRLVGEEGSIDPWFRFLKLQQENGETAVISTFAAHATCYPGKQMALDRDYPGPLVERFEQEINIDFAAFAAGAVGSMGPGFKDLRPKLQIDSISLGLFRKTKNILDTLTLSTSKDLAMMRVPLHLRSPHNRINDHFRIRPWVFDQVFGKYPVYMKGLRLGPSVWLGAPCDFSGELVVDIKSEDPMFVTSFNGGYVGYITKDIWYDKRSYETRLMNWYGPENGEYFVEIMNKMLESL